jgi:hypothetical protein
MEIFITDKHGQFIISNVDGDNAMAFLGRLPKPLRRRGFADTRSAYLKMSAEFI